MHSRVSVAEYSLATVKYFPYLKVISDEYVIIRLAALGPQALAIGSKSSWV